MNPYAPSQDADSRTLVMRAERSDKATGAAYAAQEGTWTLTAPDGRQWQADSPLRVVRDEQAARVPASVRMARINAMVDEVSAEDATLERDAARYRWLRQVPTHFATYLWGVHGAGLPLNRIYINAPERLDAAIDAALASTASGSSHNARDE
jgi:hypothetical protein